MGKPIVFVMGEKSHLIALRCAVGVFPPGLQKKKKERKRIKTLVGAVVFSTHRWRSWCHFSTINKGSEQ